MTPGPGGPDAVMNPPERPTPYWRLSGFYFFYFASLGALIPYWGLYLQHRGFSAVQIGELMAAIMVTKIVSPNVWGWIADHTGRRMAIVRLGSLLGLLAFAGVFAAQGYWPLLLVMLAFSFFWNATLPQFEVTTLDHLQGRLHRYSSIRLWGSVGFIVAVAVLGPVLAGDRVAWLPGVLLLLFAGIWLTSLAVPERAAAHRHLEQVSLKSVLLRPEVIALLAVCFLLQASHGPYYTFYSIYLEMHGYSRALVGQLWALGVVAEVGVFLLMHRLTPRYGLRRLFLAALLLTALRWWLIGAFATFLPVLLLAQLLHAASFGVYHAVAIQLFHQHFPGRLSGRGQALYSSVSFGAGGAAGSLYSGAVWEGMTPEASFFAAAGLGLLAWLIAWRWIRARHAPWQ